MPGKPTLTGMLVQYEEPEWDPLRAAVGLHRADWFMWMAEIELDDGSRVHSYKHVTTRRYMHLATDGRAFVYLGNNRYRQIDPDIAADLVFVGWEPDDDE